MIRNTVKDIRAELIHLYRDGDFVIDKTGVKMVEIVGTTFIADEDCVFGELNHDYIRREKEWYESQSLSVKDIPGKTPAIWEQVADKDGFINSNYGWCIYSEANGNQYHHVLNELKKSPFSRRATMIYNRPSMHVDYNKNGMSDFMCTYAVQFFIRDFKLVCHVLMRSNDAIFGYRNDLAWQKHVQQKLLNDLNAGGNKYELGDVHWTASSFHVYERHFNLIENHG